MYNLELINQRINEARTAMQEATKNSDEAAFAKAQQDMMQAMMEKLLAEHEEIGREQRRCTVGLFLATCGRADAKLRRGVCLRKAGKKAFFVPLREREDRMVGKTVGEQRREVGEQFALPHPDIRRGGAARGFAGMEHPRDEQRKGARRHLFRAAVCPEGEFPALKIEQFIARMTVHDGMGGSQPVVLKRGIRG